MSGEFWRYDESTIRTHLYYIIFYLFSPEAGMRLSQRLTFVLAPRPVWHDPLSCQHLFECPARPDRPDQRPRSWPVACPQRKSGLIVNHARSRLWQRGCSSSCRADSRVETAR